MKFQKNQVMPDYTKKAITKVQLVKYAGASGDFNPLHFDEEFAQKRGLKKLIAHGMLSMGFLSEYAESIFGVGKIKKIHVNFKSMVFIGEEITCYGIINSIDFYNNREFASCSIEAKNKEGNIVTSGLVEAWSK
ncbi:MAG: MaoC/PaaZ C-terminal domain-containing protein [Nitrospinota bacterium]|nr:MaoC/PaaZ C-terminal domain-containing protein [Nitrospinota bacterium]